MPVKYFSKGNLNSLLCLFHTCVKKLTVLHGVNWPLDINQAAFHRVQTLFTKFVCNQMIDIDPDNSARV